VFPDILKYVSVLIPPIIDKVDLAQLIQKLDGIILTGGDDLHPKYYGETSDPLTPKPFHLRRGEHDRYIFEYIWEHKVPTLAICLGMQEVNVFLGGSLYQDIPAQIEDHVVHKIGDWFEARHEVTLEAGSFLHELTGQLKVDANSAHHQAIREVPEALRVTGRSADNIVEVLEPRDATSPLVAVQWRPAPCPNRHSSTTTPRSLSISSPSRLTLWAQFSKILKPVSS